METLLEFCKKLNAKKVTKVNGPNGAFISIIKGDDTTMTLPVGKRSQVGTLSEYSILVAENGQAIVTANNYEVAESLDLTTVKAVEKEVANGPQLVGTPLRLAIMLEYGNGGSMSLSSVPVPIKVNEISA